MKFLTEPLEDFESICEEVVLDESIGHKKNYYIKGPFLQSEVKNRNARIYPKSVVLKEVTRYINEKMLKDMAVGELGHPNSPTINLDRVSHKIIDLKESNNDYLGKALIVDTPMGKIVKNLIDEKIRFGVSSRGLGSTKESNGASIVQSDFFLVTPADIVSDPSGPQCFVDAIMENKEWVWENGKLIEHEVEIKNIINTTSRQRKLSEKSLMVIFETILNKFV